MILTTVYLQEYSKICSVVAKVPSLAGKVGDFVADVVSVHTTSLKIDYASKSSP